MVDVHGRWFAAKQEAFTRHLPLLAGPDGFQETVTRRYRQISALMAPLGMHVTGLRVNERRAWRMQLSGGLEVRLGRDSVDDRLRRFLHVYPRVLEQRAQRLAAVDLRYTNGFAVRWKPAENNAEPKPGES